MKQLIFINGTMGSGKTTISNALMKRLQPSVFLDGDWCWNMNPFIVNDETKELVVKNIVSLLNNFLSCHSYQYIIFCWVMDKQEIIDTILSQLSGDFQYYGFSLLVEQDQLIQQLNKDIEQGIRSYDVIARSLEKLDHYNYLNTTKIVTSNHTIDQIVDEIIDKIKDREEKNF